ncbi:MAG: response regulator [Ginsengibacter sp.]
MKKIVVIDDNRDLLQLIRTFLLRKGFQVSVFTDASKAINDIRMTRPQLVITDVFIKNVDGLEICNKLRSNPTTRRIPILVFSGFSKMGSTAVYEYGATDFLAKPFSLGDFLAKIYEIIPVTNIQREKRRSPFLSVIAKQTFKLRRKAVPLLAFIKTVEYFAKTLPARRPISRRLSI